MVLDAKIVLYKLLAIGLLVFMLSVVLYIYYDKIIGSAVFIGGFGAFLLGLFYYYKLHNKQKKTIDSQLRFSNIILRYIFGGLGIIIIILSIILYVSGQISTLIFLFDIGLGIVLLGSGIHNMKSKNRIIEVFNRMPLLIKLVMFYLCVSFFISLVSFINNIGSVSFFFGIIISYPVSIFLSIFYLGIPLVMFMLILMQKGWKTLLILELFTIINTMVLAIKIITTPVNVFVQGLLGDTVVEQLVFIPELEIKIVLLVGILLNVVFSSAIIYIIYINKVFFKDIVRKNNTFVS